MQNQTDLIYFTSALENIKQLYCILNCAFWVFGESYDTFCHLLLTSDNTIYVSMIRVKIFLFEFGIRLTNDSYNIQTRLNHFLLQYVDSINVCYFLTEWKCGLDGKNENENKPWRVHKCKDNSKHWMCPGNWKQ